MSAGEINGDPAKWAKFTAEKFNITVLLKGNQTYLANPNRVLKLPPSPTQLATAGTGDILAGIIGGLLAINHDTLTTSNLIEIAATGALVHSAAAEFTLDATNGGPLDLADVIKSIAKVI